MPAIPWTLPQCVASILAIDTQGWGTGLYLGSTLPNAWLLFDLRLDSVALTGPEVKDWGKLPSYLASFVNPRSASKSWLSYWIEWQIQGHPPDWLTKICYRIKSYGPPRRVEELQLNSATEAVYMFNAIPPIFKWYFSWKQNKQCYHLYGTTKNSE